MTHFVERFRGNAALRELGAALWLTLRDPDYRPHYQDEYQRLWHEAAADAERLRNLAGSLLKIQTQRGLGRFFPDELPMMDELAKVVRRG